MVELGWSQSRSILWVGKPEACQALKKCIGLLKTFRELKWARVTWLVLLIDIQVCRRCIEGELMHYPVIVDIIYMVMWCDSQPWCMILFKKKPSKMSCMGKCPRRYTPPWNQELAAENRPNPPQKKHVIFQTVIFQVALAVSLRDNNSLCF